MGVFLLSFLDIVSTAMSFYTIGLIVYSVVCLLEAQNKSKQKSFYSDVQAALSVFYEIFTSPIRKKLNLKVDISGFVLLLIIYFIQDILIFSGFSSVIRIWARS
jgi:uncharacterized protein YggT (Ycf19 family)